MARFRAENPKLQQQFADLKRGLSAVSDSEWDNIPEVGNLTRRKRQKQERSYVVPDSVLVGDRAKTEYENALDPMQQDVSGLALLLRGWNLTTTLAVWRLEYSSGIRCINKLRRNRSSS
jgi:pre-mRNA-processing factor 6